MEPRFARNQKTIKDFVSDGILEKFVSQLPWKKDQLFTHSFSDGEYKDLVKMDQCRDTEIKLKDGTISGLLFLKILMEYPKFQLGKHNYEFNLSSFYRTGLTPKKHINKWPGFHVRKIISKVKEAV